MIKGDYQGTGGYLPHDQVKRLREAPNVKIVEAESMRIMMFQINNQRAAAERRRTCGAPSATSSTTTGFNKEILGGSVERNPVPIPNNLWGVPKDVKGYSYDIDKAKQELARAKAQGRPAAHRRLPHRLQPDGAGGDGDGQRPPQDRHRVASSRASCGRPWSSA